METTMSQLQHNIKTTLSITSPTTKSKEYSKALQEADQKLWAHCLIATPLADTGVAKELLAKALTSCFQLHKTLKVITLKNHDSVVILRFTNDRDMNLVFNNGPWSVFGQLLLLLPFNKDRDIPEEMNSKSFSIWFGMKNLPLTSRTASHLLELVEDIMEVGMIKPRYIHELDDPEEFRIQGLFDRNDFLPAGRTIKNKVGVEQFVSFVYEKLPPAFCSICRKMGHDYVLCPKRKASTKTNRAVFHVDSESSSSSDTAMELEESAVGLAHTQEDEGTKNIIGDDLLGKKSTHPHPRILSDRVSVCPKSSCLHTLPPSLSIMDTVVPEIAPKVVGSVQKRSATLTYSPSAAHRSDTHVEKSAIAPSFTPANAVSTLSELLTPPHRLVTNQISGTNKTHSCPDVKQSALPSSSSQAPTPVSLQNLISPPPIPTGRRTKMQKPVAKPTARQTLAAEARKERQTKRKQQNSNPVESTRKSKKSKLVEACIDNGAINSQEQSLGQEDLQILPDIVIQPAACNVATTQNNQTVNWESVSREVMEEYLAEEGGSSLNMESMRGRISQETQ